MLLLIYMKNMKEKKKYIEAKVLSSYNSRLVCYVEREIAIPNDLFFCFFSHGTFFFLHSACQRMNGMPVNQLGFPFFSVIEKYLQSLQMCLGIRMSALMPINEPNFLLESFSNGDRQVLLKDVIYLVSQKMIQLDHISIAWLIAPSFDHHREFIFPVSSWNPIINWLVPL